MRRSVRSYIIGFVLVLAVLAFGPGRSLAVSILFDPDPKIVSLGETFDIDLIITGLGELEAPSLGGFDLLVDYDMTLLDYVDYSLGTLLGDPDMGEAFDFSSPMPGTINLGEVSFLSEAELDALQPGGFALATLTFEALALTGADGTDLDLSVPFFSLLSIPGVSDGAGDLLVADLDPGKVIITEAIAPVPEPATMLLLGTGLIGLAILRRKFS